VVEVVEAVEGLDWCCGTAEAWRVVVVVQRQHAWLLFVVAGGRVCLRVRRMERALERWVREGVLTAVLRHCMWMCVCACVCTQACTLAALA